MLTLDTLKAYGADTETGLSRCVGMEDFYYKLIRMCLTDANFESLGAALDKGDLKAGFEHAHALKGAVGNLALTPLFDAICAIVEPLRIQDASVDYAALYKEVLSQKQKLEELDAE